MTNINESLAFFEAAKGIETDACIVWPYCKTPAGYGQLKHLGYTHRLICEWKHGPPKSNNLVAAHRCGNASCLNYRHLRWATREENEADKVIHGTTNRGEKQGAAKLTAEKVLEIRELLANNTTTYKSVGDMYGVSPVTIFMIAKRKNWGWL